MSSECQLWVIFCRALEKASDGPQITPEFSYELDEAQTGEIGCSIAMHFLKLQFY